MPRYPKKAKKRLFKQLYSKKRTISPTWSTAKADKVFSLRIRERDKKCLFCGRMAPQVQLQCSHFWSRRYSATRYSQINCITLCASDHWKVEKEKQGYYRDFMMQWLGEKDYDELRLVAHTTVKRKDAIAQFQASQQQIVKLYSKLQYRDETPL